MWDYIFSVNFLWWLIICLYVPSCLGLIVLVLLQKGKGVGFAGAFGMAGGSEAVFGPRSARSLPQRMTYTMAALFMLLALIMSTLSGKVGRGSAPELADVDETATLESASINSLLGVPATEAPATIVNTITVENPATDTPAIETTTSTEDATETEATDTPASTDATDDSEGTTNPQ